MIKATELRIGNLILESGEESNVYMIDRGGISFYRINDIAVNKETGCTLNGGADRFKPIPLTPELLRRMGCKVQTWEGEDAALVDLTGLFVSTPFYQKEHSLSISSAPKTRKLKYVHEFQNYYQVITGEELIIKETV